MAILIPMIIVSLVASFFIVNVHAGYITKEYNETGFTGLDVGYGMSLTVKQGVHYNVQVRIKDNHIRLLRVKRNEKVLKFSLRPYSINTSRIEISVTMPELTDLNLSGGSTAVMEMNVPNENITANLSGGSSLTGSLQAKRVTLGNSGGSRIDLAGQADSLNIGGSGGSRVLVDNFSVKVAKIDLSGGSIAKVSVAETMDVNASGGSQVYYRGNPRLGKTSFSGGSGIQSVFP